MVVVFFTQIFFIFALPAQKKKMSEKLLYRTSCVFAEGIQTF